MSCINFLEHPILHVSYSLVVRTLASGVDGPGSNPGGVTCGISEEILRKLQVMHGVTELSGENQISMIICSQKMSFPFIEISTNIC